MRRISLSLIAPALALSLTDANDLGVDVEAVVVWAGWWKTVFDEGRTKDRSQSPADVPTESSANSACATIWHPVALSCDTAASNTVAKLAETRIGAQDFVGRGL